MAGICKKSSSSAMSDMTIGFRLEVRRIFDEDIVTLDVDERVLRHHISTEDNVQREGCVAFTSARSVVPSLL